MNMNLAPSEPPEAATNELANQLRTFGEKVRRDLPAVLQRCQATMADGSIGFVDQPGLTHRVRPWCDAVEIAAMCGQVPAGRTREAWIETLRGFQDAATGLVREYIPESAALNPPPTADPRYEDRYNTMILHYALECLGSRLAFPVANAEAITALALVRTLESLAWKDGAWGAGHWIDTYASCLCANQRSFGGGAQIEALFAWLDTHGDPISGLWGTWRTEDRWLQPVNGFYRLTRGTYAQFGRPLPYPRATIDTLLTHAVDPLFFARGKENACNVLDVVHPLWLCLRQSRHRREEALRWVGSRLPTAMAQWENGRGMAFDLAADHPVPGLQGTEMWLSIIYLMADLMGLAEHLGYQPCGVHRLEAVVTV